MAIVMNMRDHAVTLTVGTIGARDTRNVDTDLPLEASLLADGILSIVDSMVSPPSPPTAPGAFKGTVSTASALPTSGNNDGDVRVTADTYFAYVWRTEDEEWAVLTAGGGGSGPTVVVSENEPSPPAVWFEIDGDGELVAIWNVT